MSTKRTAAESNDGEATNEEEDSNPVQRHGPKRAKLVPGSNTLMQDLPIKLLERILVNTVIMEVRSMKLAKRVWKEKADLVINRLKAVSLHWTFVLTTNGFLTEVYRILDGSAQDTIRFEIVQSRFPSMPYVQDVATMKEEIFLLYDDVKDDSDGDWYDVHIYKVHVYDRSNTEVVKDVVTIPRKFPRSMEACNVSNCLYVLCEDLELIGFSYSVVRVKRDERNQFQVLPWIRNRRYPTLFLSVLPNGVLCVPSGRKPVTVSNYDANGSLVFSANIYGLRLVDKVIQRSNGNLIVAALSDFGGDCWTRLLTEIDKDGRIVRQCTSSLSVGTLVHFGDVSGRIWITDMLSHVELLDSELNHLGFYHRQLGCRLLYDHKLHYNSERNEMVSIFIAECSSGALAAADGTLVTTLRFIEE